ncbi:MAG: carboxyl transferase domain-containing protein [Gammaproteobacteria bacterium]|nr:carboxyl transferase domain-containing protein [Gammaproteobacteria bacterium]
MSWHKEAHEIALRRELSKEQGGEEGIARQHEKGRLTIRERIDHLLDAESFEEHGEGAGFAEKGEDGSIESFSPANYVVGLGEVGGRRVAVGGEDFYAEGGIAERRRPSQKRLRRRTRSSLSPAAGANARRWRR